MHAGAACVFPWACSTHSHRLKRVALQDMGATSAITELLLRLKTQYRAHAAVWWCRGRPLEGELTSLSVFLKISLASSKEHCSSLHSLSREPDLSSSRNELARLCLCRMLWASSWVMKTEKWEFHETFTTSHAKMAQKHPHWSRPTQ